MNTYFILAMLFTASLCEDERSAQCSDSRITVTLNSLYQREAKNPMILEYDFSVTSSAYASLPQVLVMFNDRYYDGDPTTKRLTYGRITTVWSPDKHRLLVSYYGSLAGLKTEKPKLHLLRITDSHFHMDYNKMCAPIDFSFRTKLNKYSSVEMTKGFTLPTITKSLLSVIFPKNDTLELEVSYLLNDPELTDSIVFERFMNRKRFYVDVVSLSDMKGRPVYHNSLRTQQNTDVKKGFDDNGSLVYRIIHRVNVNEDFSSDMYGRYKAIFIRHKSEKVHFDTSIHFTLLPEGTPPNTILYVRLSTDHLPLIRSNDTFGVSLTEDTLLTITIMIFPSQLFTCMKQNRLLRSERRFDNVPTVLTIRIPRGEDGIGWYSCWYGRPRHTFVFKGVLSEKIKFHVDTAQMVEDSQRLIVGAVMNVTGIPTPEITCYNANENNITISSQPIFRGTHTIDIREKEGNGGYAIEDIVCLAVNELEQERIQLLEAFKK